MDEALAQVKDAVADLRLRPVWAASSEEAVAVVDTVQVLITQLTAVQASYVHELDARGIPVKQGAASTGVWLRDQLHISIHAAKRLTALGAQLDSRPVMAAVVGAGEVTVEQAAVIATALAELPSDVGSGVVDRCETVLIDQARSWEPHALRAIGERILAHVAPEVAEEALRRKLERDEELAYRVRGFTMTPTGRGIIRLSGSIDAEAAAIVSAAIDPLCRPTPSGCGRRFDNENDHGQDSGLSRDRSPDDRLGIGRADAGESRPGQPAADGRATDSDRRDPRTPAQRRADALVEVCRLALSTTDLPDNGGTRPQVAVTLNYDTLTGQIGAGTLDTGQHLTAAAARRMACDAEVIPAVLGGRSEVLDLGRSRRLFTGTIRRALILRDGGCAFPSCDRPPRWCDGHHLVSWLDGGTTDLANGVLLCRRHHRAVHHDGWQTRIGTDELPEFIPPAYVDPLQRPRRNRYHRRP